MTETMYFFRVKATNDLSYAMRVLSSDLQTASDYVTRWDGVLSWENIVVDDIPDNVKADMLSKPPHVAASDCT